MHSLPIKHQLAAYAMQGLVAEGKCANASEIAELAYEIAEAMMKVGKAHAIADQQREGVQ